VQHITFVGTQVNNVVQAVDVATLNINQR